MRIKVGGKYWDLIFSKMKGRYLGRCDAPHIPQKKIKISNCSNIIEKLSKENNLSILATALYVQPRLPVTAESWQ